MECSGEFCGYSALKEMYRDLYEYLYVGKLSRGNPGPHTTGLMTNVSEPATSYPLQATASLLT